MKVALLGSFPPLKGISSYCLALATALAQFGSVEFISFKRIYPAFLYPGGSLQEDPTFPQRHPSKLSVRRNLTWYNPLSWLQEALFSRGDVLHAQWWSLPLAPIYLCLCGVYKLRRKPVVLTVHNVLPHEHSGGFVFISRLLFRLVDRFIVHTAAGKRQLTAHFCIAPERISVIPHGLLDFHVRPSVDRQLIRNQLGIGPDDRVVLLFGAIRPYKGVDTAIDAFASALAQVPRARLLIAGKPWEPWSPYAAQIERLGIGPKVVAELDYIPSGQVHRYFEAADLVLLPYRHFDSQSGVGVTAAAFCKPMIVSDVGGLPDLAADRRWVVPPGDSRALAQAMVACLEDPAVLEEMQTGAESIRQRLSWPRIAKNTWAVYESVSLPKSDLPDGSQKAGGARRRTEDRR